jgi:hypothetical protein
VVNHNDGKPREGNHEGNDIRDNVCALGRNIDRPVDRHRTGDYQSTPPNLPEQPQFTHWPIVTPFALKRADQLRPGPPPALISDRYSDDFN